MSQKIISMKKGCISNLKNGQIRTDLREKDSVPIFVQAEKISPGSKLYN